MARGINKVILVGNLGNDPDTKYTQGGMAVTRISLATTSVRKDREGNKQERTEWHRVVFFGKLGEIAGEYLRKGSQVYVEGEIRYDKYTGQDGVEKYSTDIVADEMQMLGGRGEGAAVAVVATMAATVRSASRRRARSTAAVAAVVGAGRRRWQPRCVQPGRGGTAYRRRPAAAASPGPGPAAAADGRLR